MVVSVVLAVVMALLFLIVPIAIITYYKYCFEYWKEKGVNSIEPSIPFGHFARFFFGKTSFGEVFKEMYLETKKRKWPFGGFYVCSKPVFIPTDNDLIKKILVTDFQTFPNHGLYINEKVDPFSGHIFNMEDYKWKNLRAKFPIAFTAAKMRRNVVIMERISQEFLKRIDKQVAQDKSVNIKDTLAMFTIDVVCACAFGLESGTLKDQNADLLKHSRPFFDSQWSRTSNTLVLLIPRPILSLFKFKLFPVNTTKYFMNMFKRVKENREMESLKRNDLTDLLIDLCDETKEHPDFNGKGKMDPLTFNEFATQMLVFFEAGFETSSSTQTLALYELAANPEIQDRLRKEINTVLDKHNGHVGYDSINDMEYLDRVIDETLRKYPIFPILPRVCNSDYQIKGTDVTIPKNTFVMVTNFGIHYDPEYYPEPEKFDPDRFTAENKAKRPYCTYLPFGEGPRICVGKRFGLWQTRIGLLSIIRNYKITLSKKMLLPFTFEKSGLILKAKGDVWIDLEKII